MRRIFILTALSLMIASGFVIWGYLNFKSPEQVILPSNASIGGSESKAEDSHKEDGIIKLNEDAIKSAGIVIEDVKKMAIDNYITATGEVKANAEKEAYITPRIPGKVVEVKVRLGEDADKGEILARIDSVETEEIRAGFIGAAANLKAAEANLEKERLLYNNKAKIMEMVIPPIPPLSKGGERGVTSEDAMTFLKDADLGKAKADILRPMARLELAESNLKRERELYQDNISSMKEVIAAEKEHTGARIEFQTGVEEMFLNAKNELAKAEAEYMSAKARIEERREHFYHYGFSDTEIDEMVDESRKYGHATIPIIAPFKGRIVERVVTVGQVVDISTKLFKLIDLSTVWVWANVYEKDLGKVKIGQTVYITVSPYPDNVFTGKITYISDIIDPATRTVKVRAELENPPESPQIPPLSKGGRGDFKGGQGGLLKPEMFATVKIDVGRGFSLAVPESAIQREGENTIVFVTLPPSAPPYKGGEFEKRVVAIGHEVDGYHPVISGLKEGERIVTKGAFTLKSEALKESMEHED
ncbi:MAG: efflux RND transporter periplasmic adaptor subunit [Nitrospinae bacterium]|nr:efflux RND transporter periplasmic adaptor subunit [Nitrospinota bacterium]